MIGMETMMLELNYWNCVGGVGEARGATSSEVDSESFAVQRYPCMQRLTLRTSRSTSSEQLQQIYRGQQQESLDQIDIAS